MSITTSWHPFYAKNITDYEKWRLTYEGGDAFLNRYLKKFSHRETDEEFKRRKEITPIPTYAAAAIDEIRNSIYDRLDDVIRRDGSMSYMNACDGLGSGVDRRGKSMKIFLGMDALTELMVMGRVGVYVDAPASQPATLATRPGSPYVYRYRCEDILNWAYNPAESESEFKAVYLRETILQCDGMTGLPTAAEERYRKVWLDDEGWVTTQMFNREGVAEAPPVQLKLREIPFVLLDIPSIIEDVANHQIALLNLGSSDIDFCLQSNFPFYVEQRDLQKHGGSHLKKSDEEDENEVGSKNGVLYDLKANPPGFINPSSEPLNASLSVQDRLEGAIRKLVHLAVENLGRVSAESKQIDNQGLNAGLSYLGLQLQTADRKIAKYWAAYENQAPELRAISLIQYPTKYSLKSDAERLAEAKEFTDLMKGVPSTSARKEVWKTNVSTLLAGKVKPDKLKQILQEIEDAKFTTSDPEVINAAHQEGYMGDQLAGIAVLGLPEDEYLQAREDHAERVKRIALAQTPGGGAGARGVGDLSADSNAAIDEKAKSQDTTLADSTQPKVRGAGK